MRIHRGLWLCTMLVLCVLSVAACGSNAPTTHQANGASSASGTATAGPTVLFQDVLNASSQGWSASKHCVLKADGFHFTASYICFAPAVDADNVDISVQVRRVSGLITHFYGIVFRHASSGNYYEFAIDSNGKWTFWKMVDGDFAIAAPYTPSKAIKTGLNATNTLEVRAFGSTLTFFVNGAQVGQKTDTTYTSGSTGLEGQDGIEVVYSHFKMTATK